MISFLYHKSYNLPFTTNDKYIVVSDNNLSERDPKKASLSLLRIKRSTFTFFHVDSDASAAATAILGQFHQCVYTQLLRAQIQKAQKLLDLTVFYALLGSACVKAARKHIGEIDPLSTEPEHQKEGKLTDIVLMVKKISIKLSPIFFLLCQSYQQLIRDYKEVK